MKQKIRELDVVKALVPLKTHRGVIVPEGTLGTVVLHPRRSEYYVVEFGEHTDTYDKVYGEVDATADVLELVWSLRDKTAKSAPKDLSQQPA